jgi:dihydrofolate reductase
MRRLLLFMVTTVDGFVEGPNQEFDWPNVDEEFNQFAIDQLNSVDTLVFGRVTYESMASYWPTEAATTDDPIVAGIMNQTPKIVFSTTMERAGWNNTRLVKDDPAAEIAKLKQQPGQDMIIFGSSNLVVGLAKHGLIDEFRIMINPVALGSGKPLFDGMSERLNLTLSRATTFSSGNVLLCYQPRAA